MKKILLGIIVIAIICCHVPVNEKVSAAFFMPTQAESQKNKDELIITLLTPQIEKAIENYYGTSRRYEIGDSEIEILQRGDAINSNIFKIAVRADTFEGPHNDYYTEILIFTITPQTATLDDYRHSEFIPKQSVYESDK